MRKIVLSIAGLALAGLLASPIAFAQTTVQQDITAQIELINKINQQIKDLQAQLATLTGQQHTNVVELARFLNQGSSGDDVRILQAILAADATVYPEGLITGFYGPLTARAVSKFQEKHGISPVGRVGPQTLAKLKEVRKANSVDIEADSTGQRIACAKVPPGHLVAPGWLRKNDGVRPIVPACQKLPPGIAEKVDDDDDEDDDDEDEDDDPTDTIGPVISAVNRTNITATGAKITWTTNKSSNSKVYYGTTTPLSLNAALTVVDSAKVKSHSLNLTGLTANTAYYFVVESTDASGNTSAASERTFTTEEGDDDAPSISNIDAGSISTTGATITWTTNESATSKVFYSTSEPVNVATAPSVSSTNMVTSHSLNLTGLTPDTEYHFLVQSKDGSNNTATSGDQAFTTADDNTGPVISSIQASVTGTTATITWTTNESASSKVYHGTTTPLDLNVAANVNNNILVTSHFLQITGLTINTSYRFVIESEDASDNMTRSSEQQFTTLGS